MSRLRRLWGWLEPGLIYMDPVISMAYHMAMAPTTTPGESASADRSATVLLIDVSRPPGDQSTRSRSPQTDLA